MRAALAGRGRSSLKLLAVTVLTSYDDADAREAGYAQPVDDLVAARCVQARDIGIDGIVCAAPEAARVRAIVGPDRLIVTPGIRPAGAESGDQKRIVTPARRSAPASTTSWSGARSPAPRTRGAPRRRSSRRWRRQSRPELPIVSIFYDITVKHDAGVKVRRREAAGRP